MHMNLSEFHMVPCFHTLFTCLSHDFHTHTPSSASSYQESHWNPAEILAAWIFVSPWDSWQDFGCLKFTTDKTLLNLQLEIKFQAAKILAEILLGLSGE